MFISPEILPGLKCAEDRTAVSSAETVLEENVIDIIDKLSRRQYLEKIIKSTSSAWCNHRCMVHYDAIICCIFLRWLQFLSRIALASFGTPQVVSACRHSFVMVTMNLPLPLQDGFHKMHRRCLQVSAIIQSSFGVQQRVSVCRHSLATQIASLLQCYREPSCSQRSTSRFPTDYQPFSN